MVAPITDLSTVHREIYSVRRHVPQSADLSLERRKHAWRPHTDRKNLPFKVVDREGTLFSSDDQFIRLIFSLVLIYRRRRFRLQVTTFGDRGICDGSPEY